LLFASIFKGNLTLEHDLSLPGKSHIAVEILSYLEENPEAQDTLDGVIQWWLLERKIRYQITLVKEALSQLVKEGWVLEKESLDSPTRYQVNQQRREEIRTLLKGRAEG
jgi:hypothetical protein